MVKGGWIALHRKIRDNWIWEDPEKLKAWIDILLMVNHEPKEIPFNGKVITIKKGQKLTSIVKLADRWHWNRKRVVRYLDLLEGAGMCTTERTTSGTIITVTNWDLYQVEGTTNGTTKGTAKRTAKGTANGTQTTMSNNDNKGDKGASPQTPPNDEPDPHATDDEGIRRYLEAEEAKGRWS